MTATLYLLLPLSLLFVLAIGIFLWWAIFSGQYDSPDLDAAAILRDDDTLSPNPSPTCGRGVGGEGV